ncbi:MAG: hypothetical protein JWN21_567 [Sphingomonas bacterium]|uniref:hypothetical protein n=1 Tax=Sphingomonas bacterium TaxID=1895847 RepID=UPI0026153E40|nr:hypothetical protein [Sphingomonas bacterium]MDB5695024.1 hypothetical protein [Sphingomonas bacterium]
MSAATWDLSGLQKRLFDIIRARDEDEGADVAALAADLPEPHRDAVTGGDIAALGAIGVHPCLLIGFAYAVGVQRPAFMDRLPEVQLSPEVPRWRK